MSEQVSDKRRTQGAAAAEIFCGLVFFGLLFSALWLGWALAARTNKDVKSDARQRVPTEEAR